MNLCLFDLDHTLLPLDSDHAWGDFLVRLGWVDEEHFKKRNDEFFELYQCGRLDIAEYIDFATHAWRNRDEDSLWQAQDVFMREVIEPAVHPQALDLVHEHVSRGDLVAIVTATNEFVTRPIARMFGVEHLIAVQLETDEHGRYTGRIQGVPSFREGKVVRVEQWLAARQREWADFQRLSFYSDSMNDLALFERATDPVATNPSPDLLDTARARGWRIVHLFDNQTS